MADRTDQIGSQWARWDRISMELAWNGIGTELAWNGVARNGAEWNGMGWTR